MFHVLMDEVEFAVLEVGADEEGRKHARPRFAAGCECFGVELDAFSLELLFFSGQGEEPGVLPRQSPDVIVPHPDAIFNDLVPCRELLNQFFDDQVVGPAFALAGNEELLWGEFPDETAELFHVRVRRADAAVGEVEEMQVVGGQAQPLEGLASEVAAMRLEFFFSEVATTRV